MSTTSTRGVRVHVAPQYLPAQSSPNDQRWMFAYSVTIHNEGEHDVQLLARHWVITNGEGKTEDVRGPGVVGEKPVIKPGRQFQYTSGCPLDTPVGTMHGSYQMLVPHTGDTFEAEIAPFRLAVARALN